MDEQRTTEPASHPHRLQRLALGLGLHLVRLGLAGASAVALAAILVSGSRRVGEIPTFVIVLGVAFASLALGAIGVGIAGSIFCRSTPDERRKPMLLALILLDLACVGACFGIRLIDRRNDLHLGLLALFVVILLWIDGEVLLRFLVATARYFERDETAARAVSTRRLWHFFMPMVCVTLILATFDALGPGVVGIVLKPLFIATVLVGFRFWIREWRSLSALRSEILALASGTGSA